MRKPVALLVLLASLVSIGVAEPAVLVEPSQSVYSDTSFVPLELNHSSEPDEIEYRIDGGSWEECACYRQQVPVDFPQGKSTLTVHAVVDSEGTTWNLTRNVFVDSKDPQVTSVTPQGTTFTLQPDIVLDYEDETSGVNTTRVEATLKWPNETTTVLPGDATAEAFTYTPDSDLLEGEYALSYRVEDTVGNVLESDTPVTFTLPVDPVLSTPSPEDTFTTASPTVELRARDPSGIDAEASEFVIVPLFDRENTVVGGEDLDVDKHDGVRDVNLSYQLSDLPDGRYEVEATVEDATDNGNEEDLDWTFTVDTTPPVIDDVSHTDGDLISGEEEVEVRGDDALSGIGRATFRLGGEQAIDKEAGADGWFSGTLNTHKVDEGFQQLQVSLLDRAGNVVPPRPVNVTVDNTPPQFAAPLEVYPKTAATHVRVTGVVEDKAAGVDDVTYTVNGTGIEGSLDSVDGTFDDHEEEFAGVVDVSSLDTGRHTLYVYAEDDAGHRSGKAGAAFSRREDATASLTFPDPVNVTVERGKEAQVAVAVKNIGDVAEYVAVEVSSKRNVTVAMGARKIGPGETKQFRLTAVGGRTAGTFPLTLTADGLATDATWTGAVIVQPRPAEQERIEERFAALQERFQELNASRAEYGLEGEALETKLSSAGAAVEDVEALLEQGRYRAAEQRLGETAQEIEGTESTFTGQMTRYRAGQAASLFLHLVLFAVAAFATVFGYRAYRVEDGFAPEQAGMDELRTQFREVVDRFRGEDEEKPSGWRGFG